MVLSGCTSSPDGFLVSSGAARKLRAGVVVASAAAAADGGAGGAKEAFTKDFYRTRLLTFAAMFVGYGSYYLTRNSLSYVVPTLLEDKVVGLTMTQIGGLTSVLPVCYGAHFGCSRPPAPRNRSLEPVLHCSRLDIWLVIVAPVKSVAIHPVILRLSAG